MKRGELIYGGCDKLLIETDNDGATYIYKITESD